MPGFAVKQQMTRRGGDVARDLGGGANEKVTGTADSNLLRRFICLQWASGNDTVNDFVSFGQ